jgi:hypothetical protein
MTLFEWFLEHIDVRFLLTPMATSNKIYHRTGIGKTSIYIFGIRVAWVQRTIPWED